MAKRAKETFPDDKTIVEMICRREKTALETLKQKYGKLVYTVCFNILRKHEDSEECENDVFFKAWNSIPDKRPEDLRPYLTVNARAAAIDRFRRDHRQKRGGYGTALSLDDLSDFLEDDHSVSDEFESAQLARLLESFIKGLPERERICFVKRYYYSFSAREISKMTGIPRSTVFAVLGAAKEKLKKKLTEEGYSL